MHIENFKVKCPKCKSIIIIPYYPDIKPIPENLMDEVASLEIEEALLTLKHILISDLPRLDEIRNQYYEIMGKPIPPQEYEIECPRCYTTIQNMPPEKPASGIKNKKP